MSQKEDYVISHVIGYRVGHVMGHMSQGRKEKGWLRM